MTALADRPPSIAGSLAWTLTAMLGTRLVTLAGLMALARLLAPADFGLMAFAFAYITYVTAVGDLGTGTALIYWPSRRDEAAQVTFVISLAMGACWLALTLACAPAVATFFHNPSGEPVLRALAWTFPIQALAATHEALCRKSLRFRAWLAPELAFAICKAIVSVALAAYGCGVWSLVWGQLAGHLLRTALFWVVIPWRPSARLPRDLVGPMFTYGRSIVGVNVLSAVVHHVDYVIVARVLGAAALGFYQLGAKVPEMTVTLLVRAVSYVIFPALSHVNAEGRNPAQTYLPALKGVALVTVPGVAALVLLAEPIVTLLFGERWAPSVPVVQALTLTACFRALGTHAGDLLKATGRPGLLVVLASVNALVLVPGLMLVAPAGMVAVALVTTAVAAASMVASLVLVCRETRTSARSLLGAMWPGAGAGVAVAAGVLAWGAAAGGAGALITVTGSLAAALSAYVVALMWLSPEILRAVLERRRQLFQARRRTGRLAEVEAP